MKHLIQIKASIKVQKPVSSSKETTSDPKLLLLEGMKAIAVNEGMDAVDALIEKIKKELVRTYFLNK